MPAASLRPGPASYADATRPPAKQQPEFLKDDPAFLAILTESSISLPKIIEVVAPLTSLKRLGGICAMATAHQKGKDVTLWRVTPAGDFKVAVSDVLHIVARLTAERPQGWHHVSQWATSYASANIAYPHRLPNGDPSALIPFIERGLLKTYPGIPIVSIKPQVYETTFLMSFTAILRTDSLPKSKRIQFTNDYATQLVWSWFTDSMPAGSKFYNGWQFVKDMNSQRKNASHNKSGPAPARNVPASDPPAAAPAAAPVAAPAAPRPSSSAAPALSPAPSAPKAPPRSAPRDPTVAFEEVEPSARHKSKKPPTPVAPTAAATKLGTHSPAAVAAALEIMAKFSNEPAAEPTEPAAKAKGKNKAAKRAAKRASDGVLSVVGSVLTPPRMVPRPPPPADFFVSTGSPAKKPAAGQCSDPPPPPANERMTDADADSAEAEAEPAHALDDLSSSPLPSAMAALWSGAQDRPAQ